MWVVNMKFNFGTLIFVLLLSAYTKSEKLLKTMKEQDQGDDQENSNDSITADVPGTDVDSNSNDEKIMKKLKELPTDKLKNILNIINKQSDEEAGADSRAATQFSDADEGANHAQTMTEEMSLKRQEGPKKMSFHRVSNVEQQPGTIAAGQNSENGEGRFEQNTDEQNVENILKSSKEMTKTGNLRQLKKLEPVTNVLIHAFEGDMDEGADIGTSLRSASRAENIAKQSNGRELEPGNSDIFAGTEDKSTQGKGGKLGMPGSRMKLARLVPGVQKVGGEIVEQSSRRKEGAIEGESVASQGRLQHDDLSRVSLELNSVNTNNDANDLKPIKLRPLSDQRGPYKNVIHEKLPDKIIEEISQAMVDRVKDSGDRKTKELGQDSSSDNSADASELAAENALDASLKNMTTGDADKRAATKSQFVFSYDPDSPIGPEMWKVLHTDWTCQGRKQSPINIKTENVINSTICKNIVIRVEPEGRPITGILRNNGHAPTFSLTNSATVRLFGATLPNDYFLKQLHFHFGCENSRGSEHKIDDQSFPMELHLVFWDKKTFDSFAQAAKSDRGIAVVAVLFQRSFVPVSQVRNTPVTQLLQVLKKIPNEGDFVQISDIFDFRLEKLIPNVMNPLQADRFYTYEGSLTTPGCYESVTWIVLNSHPVITDDQLEMFRKLKSAKVNADGTMCDNYRPIQKAYGRRIYSNII